MTEVVSLAGFKAKRAPRTVWECECERQLFYIYDDGCFECASCGTEFVPGDIWDACQEDGPGETPEDGDSPTEQRGSPEEG